MLRLLLWSVTNFLTDGNFTLGNGQVGKITGKCTLTLRLQAYQAKVTCYVANLSADMDMVLGEPWFRRTAAHLEYGTEGLACVRLWKGIKRISISPRMVKDLPQELCMSAMQCKRAV